MDTQTKTAYAGKNLNDIMALVLPTGTLFPREEVVTKVQHQYRTATKNDIGKTIVSAAVDTNVKNGLWRYVRVGVTTYVTRA